MVYLIFLLYLTKDLIMEIYEISCNVASVANSAKVVSAGASVQSAVLASPASNSLVPAQIDIPYLISPDATGFIIQGVNPVALNDGTCQIVFASNSYRVKIVAGNKLAYIPLTGAGNLYISPNI